VLLFVRMLFDFLSARDRSWRPRGAALVLAEVTYSITDPPIRLVRRFVKPIRSGQYAIDLAPLIVLVAVILLRFVVSGFLY
jgi:YggT family protein